MVKLLIQMSKKILRNTVLAIVLASFCISVHSQKIATLEVVLGKPAFGLEIPVSISLDDATYLPDSVISLYEITSKGRTAVPYQIDGGFPRKLNWIVLSGNKAGEKHTYELARGKQDQKMLAEASINDGALTIHKGSNNLLQYVFKTVYPPKGIDSLYKRSGFIHPLWSPGGKVLTRIQPRDHYHHYGIWNPWTHVAYEGDTVDLWNINTKQGTVRFANFVSIQEGSVYSEFDALHEHVVFKKSGGEKVAMNELQSVRVYPQQNGQDYFIVDFNIKLNAADKSPVKLLEYRYAGLGWRCTEKWNNKNSMVLTSEGKGRVESDGSKARWCIVQGELDDDYAGVVMMSFPTNYNYPEPLRIWPINQNGRGDMFANFCPTKDIDWLISPGKDYVLNYRFLVYNGKFEADKAESAWFYFANPPRVTIRK
jgi:hypothetical protein